MSTKFAKQLAAYAFLVLTFLKIASLANLLPIDIPFLSKILGSKLIYVGCWAVAAAGYVISFVNDHDVFDIVIGIGFASQAVRFFINNPMNQTLSSFFFLVFMATLLVWAVKFFKDRKVVRGIPLVVIVLIELTTVFVLPRFGAEFLSTILGYMNFVLSIYYYGTYATACIYDSV